MPQDPLPELEPIAPVAPVPSPVLVSDDDFTDDDAHGASLPPAPSAAQLNDERSAAMRAEYHWPVWDVGSQSFVDRRLIVSAERWTWWKALQTHNVTARIPDDDDADFDLDTLAPSAWSLLWLCLHEPAQILDVVAKPKAYWLTVNQWAAVHCQPEKWHQAIDLMDTIRKNIVSLLTMPMPTRRTRRTSGE